MILISLTHTCHECCTVFYQLDKDGSGCLDKDEISAGATLVKAPYDTSPDMAHQGSLSSVWSVGTS